MRRPEAERFKGAFIPPKPIEHERQEHYPVLMHAMSDSYSCGWAHEALKNSEDKNSQTRGA